MLSQADNELLTRVGAGTPMGDYMRRFWIPALLSKDLAEPDGDPKRIRLLGEDLLAFRDTEGRVGLIDELCPHRHASLFFGRNEECGIRCAYHGWKFDVNGNCLEQPSEPPGSGFKDKVKLKSYPTQERGGLIWAFMGPKEHMGDLPDLDWMHVPDDHRFQTNWHQPCNYAQPIEGEIDPAHVSFLHSRIDKTANDKAALTGSFFKQDTSPKFKLLQTDFGMTLGSRRTVDEGFYWRMNHFMLPFFTIIAPVPGQHMTNRIWVPIDDTHTTIFCTTYRIDRPCSEEELDRWRNGVSDHAKVIPGTWTPEANKSNDYLIDRHRQRTEIFSGIPGIRAEDAAMSESAGAIADRTTEHLGVSDTAIIRMRRLLLDGAKALQKGEEPRLATDGGLYRVRSHSAVIKDDGDFDQFPEILEAMAPKAA